MQHDPSGAIHRGITKAMEGQLRPRPAGSRRGKVLDSIGLVTGKNIAAAILAGISIGV